MPQPKQPAAKKPTAAKQPAAGKSAAKTPAAKTPAAKKKPAAKTPAAKKKPAAAKTAKSKPAAPPKRAATAKPAKRRAAGSASRPAAKPTAAPDPTSADARDEALRANLASLRDLLAGGVVLTAQRLQESIDEAVARGRITRRDAEDLASGLLSSGRQQTADLLADLEQLLGRGRSDLTSARSITRGAVKGSSERVLREVDRARRAAGLGQAFPILGYDELTAAQITARLGELTPAELRRVRDHERRTADRAGVLTAVEKALS